MFAQDWISFLFDSVHGPLINNNYKVAIKVFGGQFTRGQSEIQDERGEEELEAVSPSE